MNWRNVLGVVLLSLPFVAAVTLFVLTTGWLFTLLVFGIPAAVIGCVFLGTYLLET